MTQTQKDEDMKARYWEKLWHDIIDDIKLGPLPGELKWRFVQLIIMAGIQDENGLLPELPDMAFRLRLTEEQLRSDLPTLARRELVELVATTGDRERWKLTGYAKRQAPVDNSERKRRSRASSSASSASSSFSLQKKEETETEAEADKCHENVTNRDTHVTQILAAAGISRNRTTAPLWDMPADYIAAHLAAAQSPGLAIRKMLDGDPPPRRKNEHELEIPPQYRDIIRR